MVKPKDKITIRGLFISQIYGHRVMAGILHMPTARYSESAVLWQILAFRVIWLQVGSLASCLSDEVWLVRLEVCAA